MNKGDEYWMEQALEMAAIAEAAGEVPIGSVLVRGDKCIARGYNQSIQLHDPTAHAEMVVLRAGGKVLANYRLQNTTLYVTLEPCMMCVGALVHARIQRLVFGAVDPVKGATHHTQQVNHTFLVLGGVLGERCSDKLTQFFVRKRAKKVYD